MSFPPLESLPKTHDGIMLQMMASPLNPSDMNQIQGTYPIRPPVPDAIGGNEGIARVIASRNLKFPVGCRVLPAQASFGTWRHYALTSDATQLIRVPDNVPSLEASMAVVNMCSAYRMLKDFEQLKSGDVVVQNAANSGVGRAVIQLCRHWGYKSVNIIRERNSEETEQLKQQLKKLGADLVLLDSQIATSEVRNDLMKQIRPRLALNAVCGRNATEMARWVLPGGTHVTYGAMSRQPLTLPASLLIFQDISFRGYWMARWKEQHSVSSREYQEMMEDVFDLIAKKVLTAPPIDRVKWTEDMSPQDLGAAFKHAASQSTKQVLIMDPEILK